MRRVLSIAAVTLFLFAPSLAGNSGNDGENAKNDSSQIETEAPPSDASIQTGEDTSTDETNAPVPSQHPSALLIVSLALAAIGIGIGTYALIWSISKYKELKGRYYKLKGNIEKVDTLLTEQISDRVNASQAKMLIHMDELKKQVHELQDSMTKYEEKCQEIPPEPPYTEQTRFVSKILFGVYKPKYGGLPADQTTEIKESNATIEIVTDSATTAIVHLVDHLGKTQFGNLIGTAVEVLEGNPQSYDSISEVEAGKMELDDDIWKITSKIKVKLS